MQFPHCDARVLHAPGECEYCDRHADWQELRQAWGIAFTGHSPNPVSANDDEGPDAAHGRSYSFGWVGLPPDVLLPCPADFARPPGSGSDHRRWAGNVATTQEPVNETAASRMPYGRREWPKLRRR